MRRRDGRTPAFCLSLCILTGYMWPRSHRTMDEWFLIYRADGCERVATLNGRIMIRHERPRDGKFGGFERVAHRSECVSSLPPRPWNDDLLERRWLLFRYVNIEPPSAATLQQLRQTQAALSAMQSRPARTAAQVDALINLQMNYYRQKSRINTETYRELVFPLWLIPAVVACPFLLSWGFGAQRRRRRRIRGLCPACAYDLRATPGKCPECGYGSLEKSLAIQ